MAWVSSLDNSPGLLYILSRQKLLTYPLRRRTLQFPSLKESSVPDLSPTAQRFILQWGEMSSHWGISRSMAQIHALLYLSGRPLSADEIAETLSLARSNVSTSLRELRVWGIVRLVHKFGERCDRFDCVDDAWQMLLQILEQRKRREIDPAIEILEACVEEAGNSKTEDAHTRKRMSELLDLLSSLVTFYEDMVKMPTFAKKNLLRMGSKIRKLAG
jgi:DNA-binding transcriptional regulator GbsR (MarR family)